eukprot:scaffold14096_cov124-Isochrysis_galbana.AAC.3
MHKHQEYVTRCVMCAPATMCMLPEQIRAVAHSVAHGIEHRPPTHSQQHPPTHTQTTFITPSPSRSDRDHEM